MSVELSGWRKSTRSGAQGDCVEVGSAPGIVGVRDSKLGEGSPVLVVSRRRWADFASALRAGTFDRSA